MFWIFGNRDHDARADGFIRLCEENSALKRDASIEHSKVRAAIDVLAMFTPNAALLSELLFCNNPYEIDCIKHRIESDIKQRWRTK